MIVSIRIATPAQIQGTTIAGTRQSINLGSQVLPGTLLLTGDDLFRMY